MQQFNWQVLTQDEILSQQSKLEPGEYNFEVLSATYKFSETGNPMVELVLKIYGHDGREHTCKDYLVGTPSMAYKIKHFWEAVGYPKLYDAGNCTESDFLYKSGTCRTKLEKSKKDEERIFTKVVDYIPEKAKVTQNQVMVDMEVPDEDIPF